MKGVHASRRQRDEIPQTRKQHALKHGARRPRTWKRDNPLARILCLSCAMLGALTFLPVLQAEAQGLLGGGFSDSIGPELIAFRGIEPRPMNEITMDLDDARRTSADVESDKSGAKQRLDVARARAEVLKRSMDVTKAQEGLAKKEKRLAEADRLHRQRSTEEMETEFLNRLVQLEQARIDQANAQQSLADARVKAFTLESDLAARQSRMATGDNAGGYSQDPSSRGNVSISRLDLEKQTLEAFREVASERGDVAQREKNVLDRNLAVLEIVSSYFREMPMGTTDRAVETPPALSAQPQQPSQPHDPPPPPGE
jgi:hypothetical protein